jgi:hypothetical protein
MQHIGVTGPRRLTKEQEDWLRERLPLVLEGCHLHVGDAPGVDALARQLKRGPKTVYRVEGKEPWHYQARSKRLVEALRELGGVLYAYPNKPKPPGLTLNSWQGSGTWGTIAYAQSRGVPVHITPLPGLELELEPIQLTLW